MAKELSRSLGGRAGSGTEKIQSQEPLKNEASPASAIFGAFFACVAALPLGLAVALLLGAALSAVGDHNQTVPLQTIARPPWAAQQNPAAPHQHTN